MWHIIHICASNTIFDCIKWSHSFWPVLQTYFFQPHSTYDMENRCGNIMTEVFQHQQSVTIQQHCFFSLRWPWPNINTPLHPLPYLFPTMVSHLYHYFFPHILSHFSSLCSKLSLPFFTPATYLFSSSLSAHFSTLFASFLTDHQTLFHLLCSHTLPLSYSNLFFSLFALYLNFIPTLPYNIKVFLYQD